jgi:hypothetical protein
MSAATIATWQKARIEPEKGAYYGALEELSEACFYMIKIIERERSAIRDGDGSWRGSETGRAIASLAGQCGRVLVVREDEQFRAAADDVM